MRGRVASRRARRLPVRLAVQLALLLTAQAPLAAQSVDAIAVPVADLPTSVRFYTEVLGFREVSRADEVGADVDAGHGLFGVHVERAVLQLGDERLVLTEYLTPRGRPMPADGRSNDRWFQHVCIVVRDMDRAYAVLRRHRVRHSSPSPQTLPASIPAAAGIRAFYFQDPDGHPLEVLQFPPDKGDPRWHRPGADLFQGIDHTAVVVADTERSLRFWRDALGLRVVGSSENRGDEQARLNHVSDAHLRITTLRGRGGPGVELLQYVAPADGRPMPVDTRANDLWSWVVHVRGVAARGDALRAAGGTLPASDAAELVQVRDLPARDPDGHGVLLAVDRR